MIVVVDGAGSPKGLPIGCTHGVAWYAQRLSAAVVASLAGHPPTVTLADGLAEAIRIVNAAHGPECDLTHGGTPSAAIGIVRIADDRIDCLSLADVTVVIEQPDEPLVLCDNRIERQCPPEPEALAGLRFGTAEHNDALARLVEIQRGKRNRPDGFWVAASDPSAAYQAHTASVPRAGVRTIAALSDGATRPVDQMFTTSWPQFLKTLDSAGAAGTIDYVRVLERSDPYGDRWARTKRHDDATIALVQL
ncbi:hypothetical protein KGQ20_10930 [Catenulispora sp. NF23]|uniref:hypothetical protein n=1 Tax=Catenulispora pinistramenti TaxID=2705254 RepID=UPI001BA540CC|nr:hypothetical protein [Catenulispora pinistramenti]MBS2533287.1 hypothetical protein [Catenulispora pinistramenti]